MAERCGRYVHAVGGCGDFHPCALTRRLLTNEYVLLRECPKDEALRKMVRVEWCAFKLVAIILPTLKKSCANDLHT